MNKITWFTACILISINCFTQEHFKVSFDGKGQDHMNINILTASILGIDLKAGDEIAVFDGTICCGKVVLTKPIEFTKFDTFAVIAASKTDNDQANGYTIGNAITYKFWDSATNKEISGITPEYLNPATGNAITAQTFAPNETAFIKLSVLKTGTNNIINDQKFNVFPNPTSGKLKLTFDHVPKKTTTLTVTDIAGKTILEKNIQNTEEWINLDGNPPGIYLIKSSFNNSKAQKVIFY